MVGRVEDNQLVKYIGMCARVVTREYGAAV